MLNPEYPNFEKKSLDDLELTVSEPIKKINIRGKKKEFFTKVGKILCWPCDWTHTHRGIVSPTETKYILTGWFSFVNPKKIIEKQNDKS